MKYTLSWWAILKWINDLSSLRSCIVNPNTWNCRCRKRMIFFLRRGFFGFLYQSKIHTHTHSYSRGGRNGADLYSKIHFLPWNSPNLHISVVGVRYCKGSYWRIKQLAQKITVIWHTQTFWEKNKTLRRRKRGIQDSSWEERCEFFLCTKRSINNILISVLLPR